MSTTCRSGCEFWCSTLTHGRWRDGTAKCAICPVAKRGDHVVMLLGGRAPLYAEHL